MEEEIQMNYFSKMILSIPEFEKEIKKQLEGIEELNSQVKIDRKHDLLKLNNNLENIKKYCFLQASFRAFLTLTRIE